MQCIRAHGSRSCTKCILRVCRVDRLILMVLLMMILTISCMTTYPLHAYQWLSNVSTPVSCNVYWLQSRVCTPGVGLLVMIWLELCTSRSCSCHRYLSHSNKVQNGDILVPSDRGLPGEMAVEMGREHLVVWSSPSWVWVIIHCMCWLITCEIWFCQRFSWEWLIDQSPSD